MNVMNRVPRGVRQGGQFTASARAEAGTRLIEVPAMQYAVQEEPLAASNETLARIPTDGTLTTVVEVPADEWLHPGSDEHADMLARRQWAHSEAFNLDHAVLAYVPNGDEPVYVVEVTNDIAAWAGDPAAVENYNAGVAPEYALTPEHVAFLSAPALEEDEVRTVVDLDGHLVQWTPEGPTRVSACCRASATGTGDYVGCRSCYGPIDETTGLPPRLAGD